MAKVRLRVLGLSLLAVAAWALCIRSLLQGRPRSARARHLPHPASQRRSTVTVHLPTHSTALQGRMWASLCNQTLGDPRRRLDLALYTDEADVNDVATLVLRTPCAGGLDGPAVTVGTLTDLEVLFEAKTPPSDPHGASAHIIFLAIEGAEVLPTFSSWVWQWAAKPGGNLLHTVRSAPSGDTKALGLAGVSAIPPTYDELRTGSRPQSVSAITTNAMVQQPELLCGMVNSAEWSAFARWRERRLVSAPGTGTSAQPVSLGDTFAKFREAVGPAFQGYMLEKRRTWLHLWREKGDAPCRRLGAPSVVKQRSDAAKDSDPRSFHSLPSFDAAVQAHTSAPPSVDAAPLDGCTLVITVFDRYQNLEARLRWYHNVVYFKAIVVVWNAVNKTPPRLDPRTYRIPVYILRQDRNSMNNRFKPRREIATKCVVNMDDDWDMPLPLLKFAIRLWYRSFPQLLVGLLKNGRTHGFGADGQWRYLKNTTMPQSIVLPSGMVYHSRYLRMYTSTLPQAARNLVDKTTNCDDLLFNAMVANHTGQAPVFVQNSGIRKVHVKKRLGKRRGLWKRDTHYKTRDKCLQVFAELFGTQPLRYTQDSYWAEQDAEAVFPTTADRRVLSCRCWECNGSAIDDCVACSTT